MTAWRVHTATLFYSLLASLPAVNLFLDVGSLDGRESFAVEEHFPALHCIAFEPNPRNIELIKHEIARRESHIELREMAIGSENGTATFYTRIPLSSNNYGASSVLKFAQPTRNEEFATEAIEVPTCRLDSIKAISEYTKIALWIDVEGAGYSVLEGMAGIAHKAELVHIEVETQTLFAGGRRATDVVCIMSEYGFDFIGSNLDKHLRRHQGDMVFLRRHALSQEVCRKAVLRAALVEQLALQRLALNILPPKIYRTGRDWLVHLVTSG